MTVPATQAGNDLEKVKFSHTFIPLSSYLCASVVTIVTVTDGVPSPPPRLG